MATSEGTLFDRVLGLSYLSTKLMLWVCALVVVWGLVLVGGRMTFRQLGVLLGFAPISPERGVTGVRFPLLVTRPLRVLRLGEFYFFLMCFLLLLFTSIKC